MKERPILFSAPMVRAILDGTKTQTRRVVKFPHQNPLGQWMPTTIGGPNGGRLANGETLPEQGAIWHTRTGDCLGSPYGQPGDRLWVRETHYAFGWWETRFSEKKGRDEWHFVDMTLESGKAYAYPATDPEPKLMGGKWGRGGVSPAWWKRPAIFMPRVASRIAPEITGVRVERLQGISEMDAEKEGVEHDQDRSRGNIIGWRDYLDRGGKCGTAKGSFRSLWELINGLDSWEANPWVWVVEFERVKR